jgi:hypothetical protein
MFKISSGRFIPCRNLRRSVPILAAKTNGPRTGAHEPRPKRHSWRTQCTLPKPSLPKPSHRTPAPRLPAFALLPGGNALRYAFRAARSRSGTDVALPRRETL